MNNLIEMCFICGKPMRYRKTAVYEFLYEYECVTTGCPIRTFGWIDEGRLDDMKKEFEVKK